MALKHSDFLEDYGLPAEKTGGVVWFGKDHLKCFSLVEIWRKIIRRVDTRYRTKPGHW
jgi:hypothetical protein